jgi:predicted tellurium resistance membrane protein TerC
MEWISDPTAWSALAALLALEIVLGVDNVVFISILASKLPIEQQDKARRVGLLTAGGMRIILLLAIGWIVTLKADLFSIGSSDSLTFSGKELILLAGGVFLIYKATKEIHHKLEGEVLPMPCGDFHVTPVPYQQCLVSQQKFILFTF